jgi:hypothetical protein
LLARGDDARLVFDASARHRLPEDEGAHYEQLQQAPWFVQVPSGQSADTVLLKTARDTGACIVTRDHYRDHRKRYRRIIDDPTRLIDGWIESDRLVVPALDIASPITSSAFEIGTPLQAAKAGL